MTFFVFNAEESATSGIMNHQRRVFFAAVLSIAILTAALDRLVFGWMIFKVENHSGWDSFRWYNFEYQFRYLENIKSQKDRRKLILVIGSSIAQYSVQKDALEKDLEELSGESYRVEILSHAAMLPTDLKYYAGRIRAIHPDRILYLTNPGDLDLERYIPPWEYGRDYQDEAHADYLEIRYPMKIYYPGSFALSTLKNRSPEKSLSLLGRSMFYSVRYREEWYDPIKFSLQSIDAPLRSYLYYQGVLPKEGIFREGMTGSCFSFREDRSSLYAEIRENLLVSGFEIKFYARKKNNGTAPGRFETAVSEFYKNACILKKDYRYLLSFRPERSGWQDIPLQAIDDDEEYVAVLSHVESADGKIIPGGNSSFAGRGIRLPGDFGNKERRNSDYYVRRRGLEDVRISSLTEKEYTDDFYRRIQPPDWRSPENKAMHQLNKLRLGKFYTDWIDFKEIYQLKELNKFIETLDGIPVIVVNNPENPLTRDEYAGNMWYQGFLKYMKTLTGRFKNVFFRDMSREKKMIHFLDAHHLTYDGMLEMSSKYAKIILETF